MRFARMAESVDALVSNTNDSNVVPVRPRLRVQSQSAVNQQIVFLCRGSSSGYLVAQPRAVMSTTAALPSVKSDVVRHSTLAPGTKSICCKTADCFFCAGGLPPVTSVAQPHAVMSTTAALPSVKSDGVRHSTPAPGTKSICWFTADCFFLCRGLPSAALVGNLLLL